MPYSYDLHTTKRVTVVYPFRFIGLDKGYIRPTDVFVEVRASGQGEWVFTQNWRFETTNSIRLLTPIDVPTDGQPNLRIRRIMPKNEPYANWNTGQNYSDFVINNSFLQQLYTMHEVLDGFISSISTSLNLNLNKIINVGKATDNTDVPQWGQVKKLVEDAIANLPSGGGSGGGAPDEWRKALEVINNKIADLDNTKIEDSPKDHKPYVRKDGAWSEQQLGFTNAFYAGTLKYTGVSDGSSNLPTANGTFRTNTKDGKSITNLSAVTRDQYGRNLVGGYVLMLHSGFYMAIVDRNAQSSSEYALVDATDGRAITSSPVVNLLCAAYTGRSIQGSLALVENKEYDFYFLPKPMAQTIVPIHIVDALPANPKADEMYVIVPNNFEDMEWADHQRKFKKLSAGKVVIGPMSTFNLRTLTGNHQFPSGTTLTVESQTVQVLAHTTVGTANAITGGGVFSFPTTDVAKGSCVVAIKKADGTVLNRFTITLDW